MANFLQDFFDPAMYHSLPFKERQKRTLFIRGNMAGAFFCLFFVVVGIITGLHCLAWLTFYNMVVLCTSVFIARRGFFWLASHISFNGSVLLFLGANYFYGSVARTEIYLFVFPAIVVFMFDKKRDVVIYCVYLFLVFSLCLYCQKYFHNSYGEDVTPLRKISYMNYVFAFSMLAAIVYSFKAENLENNQKMEEQKNAIEEKSKEITDSINYAKRIQTAMMTSEDILHEYYLTKYFLFFKPKDIVSGDFYWSAHKENRIYQAVCDCTGHGVPADL